MQLAEFLAPNAVSARDDITSKKRVLEEISRLLAASAEFVAEKDVFASLVNREKLGSTGLGEGVAIPHGRVKGLDGAVAAFIRLDHGVDYDAADEQPVDLVFGLLVPQEATGEHLQILAQIAEMFQDEKQLAALREAADGEALHALITQYQPG